MGLQLSGRNMPFSLVVYAAMLLNGGGGDLQIPFSQ